MSYAVGTIIRIKSVPESTVIVLKDGDVLELRREKHTTGFQPNTWRSVDEWRSSISEDAVLEIESRFLSIIAEPDKFTKRVCETFGKLCIKSTCRSQPTLAERIAKKKEEIDDFLHEYPSLEQPHTPVTIFTGPLQTLSCLQSELHGYQNELDDNPSREHEQEYKPIPSNNLFLISEGQKYTLHYHAGHKYISVGDAKEPLSNFIGKNPLLVEYSRGTLPIHDLYADMMPFEPAQSSSYFYPPTAAPELASEPAPEPAPEPASEPAPEPAPILASPTVIRDTENTESVPIVVPSKHSCFLC